MSRWLGSKTILGVVFAVLTLGVQVPEVEAKRLGGSRSIGKQSSTVTQQRQQPAQQTTQQTAQQQSPAQAPAAAQQPPRRNWGAMLGGIAAGLGLGYLLSQMGLSGELASFLGNAILIALVVFAGLWLFRKFRGSQTPKPAYMGAGINAGQSPQREAPVQWREAVREPGFTPVPGVQAAGAAVSAPAQAWGVPADFDSEAFLRHAKVNFLRLQAAWDAGNHQDIREFTTPQMFAEISMDLNERKGAANHTDVVTVDAELLGIEQGADEYLASVRFSGLLKEAEGAAAEPFAEIWNLSKPVKGGGWLLAGIQQQS